jgi:hypothetical protein
MERSPMRGFRSDHPARPLTRAYRNRSDDRQPNGQIYRLDEPLRPWKALRGEVSHGWIGHV